MIQNIVKKNCKTDGTNTNGDSKGRSMGRSCWLHDMAPTQANGEIRSPSGKGNGGSTVVSGQDEMSISGTFKWLFTGETEAIKAKEKRLDRLVATVQAAMKD